MKDCDLQDNNSKNIFVWFSYGIFNNMKYFVNPKTASIFVCEM